MTAGVYKITNTKNGCIRYSIKQNKPYCGFIFSYEPLEQGQAS